MKKNKLLVFIIVLGIVLMVILLNRTGMDRREKVLSSVQIYMDSEYTDMEIKEIPGYVTEDARESIRKKISNRKDLGIIYEKPVDIEVMDLKQMSDNKYKVKVYINNNYSHNCNVEISPSGNIIKIVLDADEW